MTTFTLKDQIIAERLLDELERQILKLLDYKLTLEKENAALKKQIKHLESQVYGGTTK
jgi:cell division septum initiation protein DivIVA